MGHGGDIYKNKVQMDFSVNLNPLGIPKPVSEAIRRGMDLCGNYPQYDQEQLRDTIADKWGLKREAVYAGNGASELILSVVRALSPKKALLFDPCFLGYERSLLAAGCEVLHHRLCEKNGFALEMKDVCALPADTDLVFVADPANPVGKNISQEVLGTLLERAKKTQTIVALDESFYFLSDASFGAGDAENAATTLLKQYDNLLIIRSMTKFLSVPGIRAGYVLGSPDLIRRLMQQLPEWNVSAPAEEVIKAGIRLEGDRAYRQQVMKQIRCERAFLREELMNLDLTVYESHAPFILFKGPEDLYKRLLQKGILIRDCSDYAGLSKGYYRIAVKDHEQNSALTVALKEIICTIR